MSYGWSRQAMRPAPVEERISAPFELKLPRGAMEVRLRVTPYASGSLALELQDADGKAFYWPTTPCDPVALAGLVPPALADELVVAIKPSALRNGMAQCLLDAGLLVDLDIEIPVDRHWARLMQVAFDTADARAQRAPAAPAVPEPWRLAADPVPPGWQSSVKRIQQAMRRHGKSLTDTDAMLAWAIHTRAIAIAPKPLPPSLGAIHDLLAPLLEPTQPGA
jgi:hypothetical protein